MTFLTQHTSLLCNLCGRTHTEPIMSWAKQTEAWETSRNNSSRNKITRKHSIWCQSLACFCQHAACRGTAGDFFLYRPVHTHSLGQAPIRPSPVPSPVPLGCGTPMWVVFILKTGYCSGSVVASTLHRACNRFIPFIPHVQTAIISVSFPFLYNVYNSAKRHQ